jgi:hypothetical protein
MTSSSSYSWSWRNRKWLLRMPRIVYLVSSDCGEEEYREKQIKKQKDGEERKVCRVVCE